ncbi:MULTISPECIES: TetR/AcrR family transcriptional regulator [Bradyrhizobium]|uniref:TetR/AcrR family transcriptional regulator n=1 Tax=Bradyrhizobium TaxID=374 RepID=UPI00155DEA68|nr:TetR family transcriptional regulator [Bradyrhizobium sp. WBAH30]MDD1545190.1 TetR family transcriptional regulator [Bradyrhizobium sp. WBAH41]MDD1558800.1 TetR family transcriptional regulator [Bradyrhizobium sp. WBAH23]MDD1566045.1 TetR family transcriptional regulator [Bradyrhizobium sp. WBAH33]MDD1591397.1 TetR family transcriptional regulator [Bradyrhizobium sp. WBAH42]NRB89718.1 TetR family transcriptional regulator [Bradyrhizobium sp. WBAH10]QCJ89765.1 TetR family transcriptional re
MQKTARRSRPAARPPGRPREFDMDTALDRAVRVFRERGYHATSIGELTAAMRLATGSIYKAFRDKHAVFLAAFERYAALRQEQTRSAAARGANGCERIRHLLLSYVEHSQGSEGRRGCLVVGSAVELSAVDPVVGARVNAQLERNESFIAGLIREGQADGSIPRHVAADDTARLMICITQGLRVVGKARVPLEGERLVGVAMKLLA